MSAEYDADVVIVGYGPVGAMVGNLLGQVGVRTIILERDLAFHTMPRAGATDDEVIRVFQAAGLVDELLPILDLGQSTRFLSSNGEPLVTMRPSGGRNGFPQLAFFYQPELEWVLHQGLARFPHVTVQRGVVVEGVHDSADGVTVWTRPVEGGRQAPVRARYVVACDGGRSTVRGLCSIGFKGATYAQPWLVVDAELEEPLENVTSFQFIGDPDRPAVTLPLPGSHHRWEFMVLPGEDHAEFASLENAERLISPWIEDNDAEILRHVVYTFHARTADRWRSGRILLAGDAAHLMPPFAGQGLASGLRDAHNLAWKLAAVLAGTAGPEVLDSYEEERRPHVVRMTTLTRISGALVQTRSRRVAACRDVLLRWASRSRYLTEGRFKPELHYRAGAFDLTRDRRGAGHAFPQPTVRTSDGQLLLLDDVIGPGWTVVGHEVDPQVHLSPEDCALWSSLGASYVAVRRPDGDSVRRKSGTAVVEDLDGFALDFFSRHGGDIAVIRPDRVVFAMTTLAELDRAGALYRSIVGGADLGRGEAEHIPQSGARSA